MQPMAKQLADVKQSGVQRLTCSPEEVEHAAKQSGLAIFRVDTSKTIDKKTFLDEIAKVLHFPDWFGSNWDALNDCLTDLDWLPKTGYVLILENTGHFAAGHKHDFDDAVEVFRAASDYWKTEGRPFWVFLG